MEDLVKEFLKRSHLKRLNIHCVGDAMIDEYYNVDVNRISPEHPIPIMLCQNKYESRPGGAANVAYQLKHLNVNAKLICFNDIKAIKVFEKNGVSCIPHPINYSFWGGCDLPIKRRYLDNGVQVAPRHDIEYERCGLSEHFIEKHSERIYFQVERHPIDVVILSDYDKGFFHSKNHRILDHYIDKITIVDPKYGPLSKWKGCTIFKPNSKEAKLLSGKEEWQDQATFLQNELECEAVVITLGGSGVGGIWKGEHFSYIPQHSVNAESVIGAGDCFAAFFATAIGLGFTPPEASEIAYNAGSIYVQRRMNRPVVPAELLPSKIVEPEDLTRRDFKLVFTNGCFDILHKGHLETLKFAKSKGEKLVVALNTDQSIKRFKDQDRPIVPLEHRLAVMAALECVDFVVSFNEDTPIDIIKIIKPDVLVKGGDYQIKDIAGSDIVREVHVAPLVPNISTSLILASHLL